MVKKFKYSLLLGIDILEMPLNQEVTVLFQRIFGMMNIIAQFLVLKK